MSLLHVNYTRGILKPEEGSDRLRNPVPFRPGRSNTHITRRCPYITAQPPPDAYNTHKTLLQLAAAGGGPDKAVFELGVCSILISSVHLRPLISLFSPCVRLFVLLSPCCLRSRHGYRRALTIRPIFKQDSSCVQTTSLCLITRNDDDSKI